MRKTGLFLVIVCTVFAVALLGWEGYALLYPDDDIALITTVVHEANMWTGGLVGFVFGVIVGALGTHFFWHTKWHREQ